MKFINNILYNDLIIFDDVFPLLLSSFRIAEYNYYLNSINKTIIRSTFPNYQKAYLEYSLIYNDLSIKVNEYNKKQKYRSKLVYTVFINNINYFLDKIEQMKTPFVFTLYPGGGFWVDEIASDEKLKRVFNSKYFKKVIVTQKITYDYLISKNFCTPSSIEFIFGGVLASNYFDKHYIKKKYYLNDKNTFDICFVANKYMPKGIDKGYDVFIEVAKKLLSYNKNIKQNYYYR